ncbi:MAG: acetyl-CoA decarbonylase/synthase complex subunit gamma, partial [Planctomycetota bacterium]
MALTGLDIFKLLPKTNCKKCGMPTCLAFAMALAQKRAKLDDCPDVSQEAKDKLAAAAAPPMRKVVFGAGEDDVQIGQETVVFRHEEKFHSPTVLGATVSDKLGGDELTKRIKAVNALQFERVGTKIGAGAVAVVNDSGSSDSFAKTAAAVKEKCELAMILVSDSPEAMAAAVAQVKDAVPLLSHASLDTVSKMAKIAKDNGCPLVAKAKSIEDLAELSEKIKAEGVEDIVLSLESPGLREKLFDHSKVRLLGLKKVFRPLGYPMISFVTDGDADAQAASAISLICKYSGVVIVDTVEQYAFLAMLTTVMNVFTDPQKPVQVEPKVYPIG